MKRIILVMALIVTACQGGPERAGSDEEAPKKADSSAKKAKGQESAAATAAATAVEAVAPSPAPEVADAADTSPSPSAEDSAFSSVDIPAGVKIPTEEDYEETAEKEITAANVEEELAKLEKALQ